jgi:D-amino peptidase
MVGFDASYAALLFCGLHSMAGAPGGVLAHSFTRQIASFAVNGIAMGEIGLTMLVAGAFGVPAVFLAGDAAAVHEAQALVPGLEGVAVKEGLSPRGVLVRAPAMARQEITAGAARAVAKARQIAPYTLPAPYRMTTRWRTPADALRDAGRPGARLVDQFTVEVVVNDLRTYSG